MSWGGWVGEKNEEKLALIGAAVQGANWNASFPWSNSGVKPWKSQKGGLVVTGQLPAVCVELRYISLVEPVQSLSVQLYFKYWKTSILSSSQLPNFQTAGSDWHQANLVHCTICSSMQAVQKRAEVIVNSEKVCSIPNQIVRATWDDRSMEVKGLFF